MIEATSSANDVQTVTKRRRDTSTTKSAGTGDPATAHPSRQERVSEVAARSRRGTPSRRVRPAARPPRSTRRRASRNAHQKCHQPTPFAPHQTFAQDVAKEERQQQTAAAQQRPSRKTRQRRCPQQVSTAAVTRGRTQEGGPQQQRPACRPGRENAPATCVTDPRSFTKARCRQPQASARLQGPHCRQRNRQTAVQRQQVHGNP